jgi:hypothetical protein
MRGSSRRIPSRTRTPEWFSPSFSELFGPTGGMKICWALRINYFSFRKFSLNFHEFTAYLATLAEDKHFDPDEVKAKLLAAGFPQEHIQISEE